jgi:signal transduction histidine kinase
MARYENLMYAENLLTINEILNDKNIAHQKTSTALSQLKMGLDNLSTGVTIADNDRIVTYVNASGVQLFNRVESKIQRDIPEFNVESLVGMNIDLFHKTPSYQRELLATFQYTVEVNMPLGGHIMNIKASPIFDENGERLGSVAEWRDITEEESRVAELAKTHAKNALLNRQMNHMQKLESIGRLTSGLAHDFNNILGCIMGYNEMTGYASEDIQDKSLRAEIENNTKQVNLAGNRAADLINKMLTYCRQDTPKNQIDDIQPTNVVIQEVLEMLKPALTSRIKIQTSLECEEIIQIDVTDLHQIMTNLVINARDAMQERGGIINVSLRKIINISAHCLACAGVIQGDFIELSVADNGSGIEPEIISRIFDPFFTTKGQGEGTGLGLSTVSGIVHQSNGHILIDSKSTKEHHGTTFRMLFPCDSPVD